MKWWQQKKRDADLERELRSDLDLEEEEQRERGLSAEEARHAALRAFGNPTLIREQTRTVWSWEWLENLGRDLRISVRTLLRSPGFSMLAVLVMALCIGAATSLFTVVRSVLLRPLPFRDSERLVMIYEHFRDPSLNVQGFNYNSVAPGDYYDWRARTHGFEDMAAWRWWQFNLTGFGPFRGLAPGNPSMSNYPAVNEIQGSWPTSGDLSVQRVKIGAWVPLTTHSRSVIKFASLAFGMANRAGFNGHRDLIPAVNLLMHQNPDGKAASRLICSPVMGWWNFRNWACRKYPPSPGRPGRFSRGWPVKPYRGSPTKGWPMDARWILI